MNTDTHTSNCYCAHCKCNRTFAFDCVDHNGVEKHRCLACGHLYSTIDSASVATTRAVHYQTGRGTLCSLDNDASIRTHTQDKTTITCLYCQNLLKH